MNIFRLDDCPLVAAKYHCDKHVVKMILETAQLLSTAHHILDGPKAIDGIYKSTHKNHPSAVWARARTANYDWLLRLGKHLCDEYTARYGRVHKTTAMIFGALSRPPSNIHISAVETPFVLCMPDKYKVVGDHVQSYRNFYCGDKARFATWKNPSKPPEWFR